MSVNIIGAAFGTIVMIGLAFAAMRVALHRPARRRRDPLLAAAAFIAMATFGVVVLATAALGAVPT